MRRFLFLRLGDVYYVIDRKTKGVLATVRDDRIETHRDVINKIIDLKPLEETVVDFIKRQADG